LPHLRQVNSKRNIFPRDDAKFKVVLDRFMIEFKDHWVEHVQWLLFAGILKAYERWTHSTLNDNLTLSQMAIHFPGRLDAYTHLQIRTG
jgi:hypothetical protein